MPYKPVYTHDKLRKDSLSDPESRAIYEACKLQIQLSLSLKKARKKRNMTQDQVAVLMHTYKPVISRLESGSTDIQHFPSLLTIAKFATAIGYQLKFGLIPIKDMRKFNKLKRQRTKK